MIFFPLRMAWRETRASWRHFLYFFVCIAVGVGALVGVSLFAVKLEHTVTREARALQGGDLEVRLSRAMSEAGQEVLESLIGRGMATTHASELIAMAAVADDGKSKKTQIVELKAVEEGYPLYGVLALEGNGPLLDRLGRQGSNCESVDCVDSYGAVVQESLLIQMGLSVGDRVRIGQATFTITGVIRKEPDRVANTFSLGPRVMISQTGLKAAALIKPGSRVRERYLIKLPPNQDPRAVVYELRGRLTHESARITTYRTAQPRLKRFLDQLSRYLGLIGLTALFVGGIGVGTTVHAFVCEKLQTIAILKTLGAESALVVRIYLFQAMFLGVVGSVVGVALGLGLQGVLPWLMEGIFSQQLLDQIAFTEFLSLSTVLPVLKGMALGVLTTLLFTLWPLLTVRDIRPGVIFRREVIPTTTARHINPRTNGTTGAIIWWRVFCAGDPIRLASAALIASGLAGLAVWQAGSWSIGLLFMAALGVALGALMLAAALLVRGLKRIPAPRSVAIRQAISNLHRPGSQATGIMASIGIGVMVIVTVSILERALVLQIGEGRPTDAPTFFFIDIQPDQHDDFVTLIREETGGTPAQTTPLVRSRLHALDDRLVAPDASREQRESSGPDGRKRWYYTREYVLTFVNDLPKDNVIVEGRWWDPGEKPEMPWVSVEEEAARNLGVGLGSTIEFDVQGAIVAARVSSLRRVDWGNLSTNFFMILSPGALEGAPYTFVATVRVPREEEVPLQQAVVEAFPNVTAINIGEVLDTFAGILDRLVLAVRAIALFCVLAGVFVMAAALAATRYRRLYESVVLKAVGATRGLIAESFAAEYALLGAVSGLIGVVLASVLSWGVLYFVFDLPWSLQPRILGLGFLITVALVVVVGFLSTFRILGQRPLSVLRQE